MLTRVFYKARSAFPPTRQADHEIYLQAQAFNDAHDISGFLLRYETDYFQILEGKHEIVLPLADRISRDPRIRKYTQLSNRHIQKRLFTHWSMQSHRLAAKDVELRERIELLKLHASPDKTAAAIAEVALLAVQKYAYAHPQRPSLSKSYA